MDAFPHIADEMKTRYIQRRHGDLAALEKALQEKDESVFNRVGHQLKGNAPTFGYDDLAEIARRMETASPVNDFAQAEALVAELREWLAKHSA